MYINIQTELLKLVMDLSHKHEQEPFFAIWLLTSLELFIYKPDALEVKTLLNQ